MPGNTHYKSKPAWLKNKLPAGDKYLEVKRIVGTHQLHTICSSGICPNIGECWGTGTATFLILGDICTRACKFCNVKTGKPLPVDPEEPQRIANSVKLMKLKHCVITSVDRDDLADGGAAIWAETILEVKKQNPGITLETLIPDFLGNAELIMKLVDAAPDIISHNLETVRILTPQVRSKARYDLSLSVIKTISDAGSVSKSGIMLGLGETEKDIYETMDDLLLAGCHIFTMGQYLQPGKKHLPVTEYIHPDIFEKYRLKGLEKGFKYVESAPLVRSSYHAEKHL